MLSRTLLIAALLTVIACGPPRFRTTTVRESGPLVTIDAGYAEIGAGRYEAFYFVDRRARLCYFALSLQPTAVDCCSLAEYPEARQHLPWCAAAGAPGTAPPSAPDAAAPAAPAAPPRSPVPPR